MATKKSTTLLQVLGELFISAGLVLMLYVVWQVYVNDPIQNNVQQKQSFEYSTKSEIEKKRFVEMRPNLKQGAVFAKIYVPRFGKNYERLIGQGTFQKTTLNVIGVGHYVSSEWPGEVGNFALAAHRTSHGAPFANIDTLKAGDRVWIETNDKWFTYEYRQTAIVDPTQVGVINDVPNGLENAIEGGHYLTMTSCHPKWSNKQRIVVWMSLIQTIDRNQGKPVALIEAQK
ncbi:MAG: hypothetical protein RLZZ56_919 [Actinomycetota bacterium]|jgi:sortase A